MSYLVLARKYRPASFDEVSGQQHVTQTLSNAIERDKIAHAYLLCGPRGVGKTSIARIFAKCLNCTDGPSVKPSLDCPICKEISAGSSLGVREIDGASHNSVDNVRELIDSFRTLPPPGYKYKVYIIDEVHMLSTAAFNALLKSLEEPPPNTVFILATTEAHKILPTVISRCQRFDLRSIPLEEITSTLKSIVSKENLKVADSVIHLIARIAEGSLRDAQSLLERVIAYGGSEISLEDASEALGVVSRQTLFKLSRAVLNRDSSACLEIINSVFSSGIDPVLFLKEFVGHWRQLFIAKLAGKEGMLSFGIDQDTQAELLRQVETVNHHDLQDLVEIVRSGADSALRSNYLRFALESLLVRMSSRTPVVELADMLRTSPSVQKKKPIAKPQIKEATVSKIVKNKVSEPAENKSQDQALDWRNFVDFISKDGQKLIAENLKRLAIKEFKPGKVSAEGPEFSVKYLENQKYQTKLLELLQAKYGGSWQLDLKVSENSEFVPGSIQDIDQKVKVQKKASKIADLMNDPQVQALKEIFPGSEIDRLGLKD